MRNNGGGNLTNATRMAQRFTNEKVLTGYIQHKTGKGHSDFSDPTPFMWNLPTVSAGKKVIVLTNRHSYSATNDFVNSMRCFPNVTLVGDKTGDRSGLPFSSELPNGWGYAFQASPHLDAQKQHIEFGIDPDKKVDMSKKMRTMTWTPSLRKQEKNTESDFLKTTLSTKQFAKTKILFYLCSP